MVVVTEGEIDALSLSQLQHNKWPVVSIPDGAGAAPRAFQRSLSWLEAFDKVIIMFDMDEPGREAAEACARILTPGKAYICSLPGHDVNDLLVEDRGSEVVDAMWNSHLWSPAGILEGDDLFAVLEGSHADPIYNFPFPDLQEKMRGIRPGEITLLAAGIFAGKSTLCRAITNSALDQGLTVGVIPLEETVQQYLRGLLGSRVGKNTKLDDVPASELKTSLEEVKDNLVFYHDEGVRGSSAIFDQLRWMSVARKVGLIILDHITIVIGAAAQGSGDDRKYADTLMAELESLVKRTQVPVIVVAHLKKSGEGKPHEEGRAVSMSDIRGSGMIPALSHNIFAYERNQQAEDPTLADFRVLKCRHTGRSGAAGHARYNEETAQLEPAAEEIDVLPEARAF